MSELAIGIDIGGTKTEAVAISLPSRSHAESFNILNRTRISTQAHLGFDALVKNIAAFIAQFSSAYPEVTAIGIGMPGSTDGEGRVQNSNTTCLNGQFFHQALQGALAQKLIFANDANCFAKAEAVLGAGSGHPMVFGIIMGTGVGGGLTFDGAFRNGPHSICGEWGHTTLWPEHPVPCYCGKYGCVEQFLSGPGVESHYRALSGQTAPLKNILQLAQMGDAFAVQCIDTFLDNYGRAVSNLINILDPDAIVLGGGVSNVDLLYTRGYSRILKYVFSSECHTPVVKNQLGDSAGVLGAALLCRDDCH
ncbi:MAG: ROK family protein [Deltaproteobacteria bacterium]|nr:ROK family protein [Deltaproteobacteria bacterium]